MSDPILHDQASNGYTYTSTTIALYGGEYAMICRGPEDFWQELGMRSCINSAVADVEEQYKAGILPCTYKTVYFFNHAVPSQMSSDEIKIGQEDEATLDP